MVHGLEAFQKRAGSKTLGRFCWGYPFQGWWIWFTSRSGNVTVPVMPDPSCGMPGKSLEPSIQEVEGGGREE